MRRAVSKASFLWIIYFAALLSGCASFFGTAEKPRIDIVNIVPEEMGLLKQTYLMELRILNPTDKDLDITGLAVDMEINGQPFARGESNQGLKVERLSTKIVQLEASSGLTNILRQLVASLFYLPALEFTYRLKGSVYAVSPSSRMPFDERGEFK